MSPSSSPSTSSLKTVALASLVPPRASLDACLDDEVIEQLLGHSKELQDWKVNLPKLDPKLEHLMLRVEDSRRNQISAMRDTRMIAKFGSKLARDMVDLLDSVTELRSGGSSTKRLERRIEELQRTCEEMVDECQRCLDTFRMLEEELVALQEDIDAQLAAIEKLMKHSRRRESQLRKVAQFATAAGLLAAAAAALAGIFFALGPVAIIAVPLAFSVVAPIIGFQASARGEKHRRTADGALQKQDGLTLLSRAVGNRLEHARTMSQWWSNLSFNINELSLARKIDWSSREIRVARGQWKDIHAQLDIYGGKLQAVTQCPQKSSSQTSRSSQPSRSDRALRLLVHN